MLYITEKTTKNNLFLKNYLAFCIDAIYVSFLGSILYFIILIISVFLDTQILLSGSFGYIFALSFYPVCLIINASIQELVFNATLGKFIFGLVITNDAYEKPSAKQILIRNIFDPLDSFWIIGSFPLVKGNGKTLGGYVSKTKLISKKELREKKCSSATFFI